MRFAWKIRNSNEPLLFTHQKRKIKLKKPSATKHSPQSNVYYMDFYRIFLLEYSLMGIVKTRYIRKNEL